MKLDIIVPHYKENTKQIMQTLTMINNQVGVPFEDILVTVVTDKNGCQLNTNLIKKLMDFKCKFMYTDQHLGPGYARQYAIDRTKGDYMIFCDSDDIFISPFVLRYFFDKVKENPDVEVIFTGYLEEMYINGEYIYERKDDDVSITCLHGKLYKRSFIEKHNIRFPNFMIAEDGAWNFKVICHAKVAIFDDDMVTYLWKYNPKSLTREGTTFVDYAVNIRSFADSIQGFEAFFDEIINNPTSQVNTNIIAPFINSLFMRLNMITTIPGLTEDNWKEIGRTQARLAECVEKYKEYLPHD